MGDLVTDVRELGPTPNLMTQGGALCQNTAAHKTPQLQPQPKKLFFLLSVKKGGVSANPKNPYQKILRFFFTKGAGGLTQSKRVLSDFLA